MTSAAASSSLSQPGLPPYVRIGEGSTDVSQPGILSQEPQQVDLGQSSMASASSSSSDSRSIESGNADLSSRVTVENLAAIVIPPVTIAAAADGEDSPIVEGGPRIKFYHPEDLMPTWKLALKKVVELIIQLLVPIGLVVMCHALLPITFGAVALPFIAFGAVFASAFMFVPRKVVPVAVPVETIPVAPVMAPVARPVQPAAEAPRGIPNLSANCWINSLAQTIRADRVLNNWFLNLPDAIKHCPVSATLLPREIFFDAEELAEHPIALRPLNPPAPVLKYQPAFNSMNAEQRDAFRTEEMQKLFEWAISTPEFHLVQLDGIYSQTPAEELFPAELEGTRKTNAIGLVQKLRQRKEAESSFQKQMISSMRPRPVPANLDIPEERVRFRQRSDGKIIQWISSIRESELIPQDAAVLFSEDPVEVIMTDALFEVVPAESREKCKEKSILLVKKLRQIAAEEQMTVEEKQALVAQFEGYLDGLDITNIAEHELFTDQLKTYQASLSLFKFFRDNAITELPLEQWNLDEVPNVPAGWFVGSDEEIAQQRISMAELIIKIKSDPMCNNLFFDHALFYNEIERLDEDDRDDVLDYLTIIASRNDKVAATRLFLNFNRFFSNYEMTQEQNQSAVALAASSQSLREALSMNFEDISPRCDVQLDPVSAFALMNDFFPPQMRVGLENTRTYKTEGMPAMPAEESPIRKKTDSNPGLLNLSIVGKNPTITSLLKHFMERKGVQDEYIQVGAGNLAERPKYELAKEENQFVRGPESLWLPIKRFTEATPPRKNFFNRILSCCYSPAVAEGFEKLTTPVVLPDTLELNTKEEGVVKYKLDAFIEHCGANIEFGHFISYKLEFSPTGEEVWYEMNDSRVRKVEKSFIERKKLQAYVPHYSRIRE